jgi:hypothetical protein
MIKAVLDMQDTEVSKVKLLFVHSDMYICMYMYVLEVFIYTSKCVYKCIHYIHL